MRRTEMSTSPSQLAEITSDFDAFVCIYPKIHQSREVTGGDHKV